MTVSIEALRNSQTSSPKRISELQINSRALLFNAVHDIVFSTTSNAVVHVAALKAYRAIKATKLTDQLIARADFSGMLQPNLECIRITEAILQHLSANNIALDFINPSHEGGVIIEFTSGGSYFLIEIFNDSDIVLLKRDGDNRVAYDLEENNIISTLKELA